MELKHPTDQPPIRSIRNLSQDLGSILPTPAEAFYPIEGRVKLLWILGRMLFWSIFWVMLGIVSLTSFATFHLPSPALMMLVVLLIPFSGIHLFWPLLSFRFWGYAVRETDLLIRSGVLWRRIVAVPFKRIQHVDSRSGPLERVLGLATLVVYTAGSQMGSEAIPGLSIEEAEQLRDFLSVKGHTHANL